MSNLVATKPRDCEIYQNLVSLTRDVLLAVSTGDSADDVSGFYGSSFELNFIILFSNEWLCIPVVSIVFLKAKIIMISS